MYIEKNNKPMTTIPDLGQAHETCGGVKLVKCNPNPPPTIDWSKEKFQENKSSKR